MKKAKISFVFALLCFQVQASIIIRSLSCEHVEQAMGIESTHPRLSWKLDATNNAKSRSTKEVNSGLLSGIDTVVEGQQQTAYQILVADCLEKLNKEQGNFWDSGWKTDSNSQLIPYMGKMLGSLQNVWWKVRIKDKDGKVSPWSDVARFSTGLVNGEKPRAKWIYNPDADFKKGTSWIRKTIDLKKRCQNALALVSSRGYHELYVNGQKADDRATAPNATVMEKRTLYVVYDISPLLKVGKNIISVWIAPGHITASKVEPSLLLQARIDDLMLLSDTSWKVKTSNLTHYYPPIPKPFFGGEQWDEAGYIPNWNKLDYDDSLWNFASLRDEPMLLSSDLAPPMRGLKSVIAKTVDRKADGTVIVDFGEYFTGQLEAHVSGIQGKAITFRTLNQLDKPTDFGQYSQYIPGAGGQGVFKQKFNWSSGRWIEVKGLDRTPVPADFKVVNIGNDLPRKGFFHCSNELLNEIYQTDLHTYQSCTLDGYTMDCAHRERRGYGEEFFSTSRGCALNNYSAAAFLIKWLRDWRDIQYDDGYIPHTAPEGRGGGGTLWSSATVLGAWDIFVSTGDTSVLKECYSSGVKWMTYLNSKVKDNVMQMYENKNKWDFLGDWARPVPPKKLITDEIVNYDYGDSPKALFFNNGIYALNLIYMVKIAHTLGKSEDEKIWQERLKALRPAIHKAFFNSSVGAYIEPNQVLLALAIMTEITPVSSSDLDKAHVALAKVMKEQGYMDAGSSGLPVFLQFLAESPQYHEWFSKILTRKEYPGYGYFLQQGYNTWPELWDPTCTSKSHTCFTGISLWHTSVLAGIRPSEDGAGYKRFVVKPAYAEGVNSVDYDFDSPQGWIKVRWEKTNGKIDLKLLIPPGSVAEVNTPAGIKEVKSGNHTFTFNRQ